jgi:LPXTG-motif cell wall-anchored protein
MDGMSNTSLLMLVFLAFVIAILYIMRRRTRQGRRTPKF